VPWCALPKYCYSPYSHPREGGDPFSNRVQH
jgi:hypothetical protein